jgi:hypothetical protein
VRTAVLLALVLTVSACGSSSHSKTTALIDGYHFGFIRGGNETSVTFDPADFLTGDFAYLVAVREGAIKKGDAVPNDYYLSNPSTATATLPLSEHPGVTVVECDAGCRMGATATWASLRRSLKRHPWPWWLRVRNGVVVRFDEQYHP